MQDFEYYTIIAVIVVLVLIGGLVAGLTIGLMSLDETNISILKASGTEREKQYAQAIEPIRKNGHLLLVTLLLTNTIVNESLPILFDAIQFTGVRAVLISTVLIVIFGEIIPQAVCTQYGLRIGAMFAKPVQWLIYMFYIISYPISRLLDWLLGHKNGVLYRHAGLKELVALHGETQAGPLSSDEVSTLQSVLDLKAKTVADVMTKLDDVFMLPTSAKLNKATLTKIMRKGNSRIPVYFEDRQHILGALLVKQLILNDHSYETPLSAVKLRKLPRVPATTPLFDMLHIFQAGASHMALVVREVGRSSSKGIVGDVYVTSSPNWSKRNQVVEETKFTTVGIVTLEDVIEELLGAEIIDETDVYIDMNSKVKVTRNKDGGSGSNINEEDEESSFYETTPFLSKKVSPSSALYYRPIKLPTSSTLQSPPNLQLERTASKKQFYEASVLAEEWMLSQGRVPEDWKLSQSI